MSSQAFDARLPAFLSLVLAIFMALPSLTAAGAWPSQPGSGKAVLGVSFLTAGTVSDAEGKQRTYGLAETGLSTYGDMGLVPRLSLGWAWGIIKAVESDSADQTGTTDPELSLSWHIGKKGKVVFALQTLAQFPLGPENPEAVPDFAPAFHSHRAFALELKPLAGWSGGPWWIQGGLGMRARTADLPWQFRYQAAAGRGFGKRVSGLLSFDGVMPLDNQGSGQPGDQEQYYGYHLAADIRILRAWQVGAQFDSMLSRGREMPQGARVNLYTRMGWH